MSQFNSPENSPDPLPLVTGVVSGLGTGAALAWLPLVQERTVAYLESNATELKKNARAPVIQQVSNYLGAVVASPEDPISPEAMLGLANFTQVLLDCNNRWLKFLDRYKQECVLRDEIAILDNHLSKFRDEEAAFRKRWDELCPVGGVTTLSRDSILAEYIRIQNRSIEIKEKRPQLEQLRIEKIELYDARYVIIGDILTSESRRADFLDAIIDHVVSTSNFLENISESLKFDAASIGQMIFESKASGNHSNRLYHREALAELLEGPTGLCATVLLLSQDAMTGFPSKLGSKKPNQNDLSFIATKAIEEVLPARGDIVNNFEALFTARLVLLYAHTQFSLTRSIQSQFDVSRESLTKEVAPHIRKLIGSKMLPQLPTISFDMSDYLGQLGLIIAGVLSKKFISHSVETTSLFNINTGTSIQVNVADRKATSKPTDIGQIVAEWGNQQSTLVNISDSTRQDCADKVTAIRRLFMQISLDPQPYHLKLRTGDVIEYLPVITVPGCDQPFSFAINGLRKLNFSRSFEICTGTCLFDSNTAQAKLANGQVIGLTDPNEPVENAPAKIESLLINNSASLTEVDTIVRLSALIRGLLSTVERPISSVWIHVPHEEYVLYLAEAYNKGLVDSKLMLQWVGEVARRNERLQGAFKLLVGQEIGDSKKQLQIQFVRPLFDISDYICEAISSNSSLDIRQACQLLAKNGGCFWERTLNNPNKYPATWQQLNYLAYMQQPLLLSGDIYNKNTGAVLFYNQIESQLNRKLEEYAATESISLSKVFIGVPDAIQVSGLVKGVQPPATPYRLQLGRDFEIPFDVYSRIYGYSEKFLRSLFESGWEH